jgi:hypothetical protein
MKNNISTVEKNPSFMKSKGNYFQIDLLKAVMIAFVIIDHSLGYTNHWGFGLELWERTAIPMFLIILGFNWGNSFKKQGKETLRELYSIEYFKKKFWRFLFPYLIFYLVSTTVGFIIYGSIFPETFSENWFLEYIVFQKSLLQGPGNWFIPVLFQSILLIPLLYWFFIKSPILTLTLCFIIEFSMHLFLFFFIGPIISLDLWNKEIYFRQTILVVLSAIGMGLWFSRDHDLFSKKNLFVWSLFPFSLVYMIAWDFFNFRLEFDGSGIVRGDYNYITFIYSALIFLIVLRLVPKNPHNWMSKSISAMSKSTFHVYLTQDVFYITLYILYNDVWIAPGFNGLVNVFGIVSDDFLTNIGFLIINWIICFSVGVFWWYCEHKFLKLIKRK